MPGVLMSRKDLDALIRRRRRSGGDRHDEVWDGIYVMSPLADNTHQRLAYALAKAVEAGLDRPDAQVFPGCNVSDDRENWRDNFRCPDVAVFLPGNPAEDRETHWLGGPDFAAEVLSRGDRARKKLAFYARVGVRELLFVDRRPWTLELHRRVGEGWVLVGRSSPDVSESLASEALGLTFRMLPADPRPAIEVGDPTRGRIWIC